MLTKRYLTSTKNLHAIMKKIVDGTAPDKFSTEHLKGLGFSSSNDRAIIPLLKDLRFLSADGTPLKRYHDYRNHSHSKKILGEALREAYADIFHINAKPTDSDRTAIIGKFKSTHNVTDSVAEDQAMTFLSLLKLADLDVATETKSKLHTDKEDNTQSSSDSIQSPQNLPVNLRYNIEIHLPATKDTAVYNAIFKALRQHLGG